MRHQKGERNEPTTQLNTCSQPQLTKTYPARFNPIQDYVHNEDFFFRSVHLGTECWAFIAIRRLESAEEQISKYGHWHNAAAHITSASHILNYLGDHVMMLTSMVLRDYLQLKVEIEGTSGEGSSSVRRLKPKIKTLYNPFISTLLRLKEGGDKEQEEVSERSERALRKTSILAMKQHPRNGYRHYGYIHY